MWAIIIIIVFLLFVVLKNSKVKPHNSSILDSVEQNEKKYYFEKEYSKYKDYSISELNDLIEDNRKESYEDYSTEDKMIFKAQKTLINEKIKNEWIKKINETINYTTINKDLLIYAQENYDKNNEIDLKIHSLKFVKLIANRNKAIDLYTIKLKELTSIIEALDLYAEIIENEDTYLLTYINVSIRVSIIIGKQKLYLTNYYFLANVWKVITDYHKFGNKITVDIYEIAERLLKSEKKLSK